MTIGVKAWMLAWMMAWLFLGSETPRVSTGPRGPLPWERWGGEYRPLVIGAALETGVPAVILHRVIMAESGYFPRAVNRANANGTTDFGICQLNSASLPVFEKAYNNGQPIDPFNPNQAIPVAARYLADNYRVLGSWWCAVAAYNCGAGRVRSRTIPASTVRYVAKVMGDI